MCGSHSRRGSLFACLRTLCTVLGTSLHTLCNTLCIQCTTNDMVTNTREVLHTAASDQNNAVLLKVVTYTGNIGCYFNTVGQSYSGNLSDSGIRLLRGSSLNSRTNASLLGRILVDRSAFLGVPALQQCGSLCFLFRNFSSLANQLVKRWQFIAPPCSKNSGRPSCRSRYRPTGRLFNLTVIFPPSLRIIGMFHSRSFRRRLLACKSKFYHRTGCFVKHFFPNLRGNFPAKRRHVFGLSRRRTGVCCLITM